MQIRTHFRIKGTTNEWMKGYLEGREMRMVITDLKSEWKRVTSRAQGSISAPIIFLGCE